jgi:hypothetical protein
MTLFLTATYRVEFAIFNLQWTLVQKYQFWSKFRT